jgi:hypothetical protein
MRDYKEISRTKPSLDPSGNNTIGLHQILNLCKEPQEIFHFGLHWCILGNLGGFAFWAAVAHS